MSELIEFATSWKTYLTAVLIFSLAPDVVLQLAVLAYPSRHPRRRELVAELKVVPRRERPFWVAEQVVSVLVEGFGARREARNVRGRRPRKARNRRGFGVLLLVLSSSFGGIVFSFWELGAWRWALGSLSLIMIFVSLVVMLRIERSAHSTPRRSRD
jgi:hypothetical protein